MPLTLAEAKVSRLNRISGVCSTSTDFLDLLNDATRQLMRRGNWWGTVSKMRVCVYSGCFALPPYVGTVLATNLNNSPVPVSNHWYEFLPMIQSDWCADRKWLSNVVAEQDGMTPVFENVPCNTAQKIRAYARCQADLGKTITFYGIDANGWPVQTTVGGVTQDGETLTLVAPYAETTTFFRTVTRVTKELSTCYVDVYMYTPTTNLLLEMAHYGPNETNPSYRHMRIHSGCCGSTTTCCPASVTLLIKLAFVPVLSDTDLVLIDNLDALALMIQAIKQSDAYDHQQSEIAISRAVHELNLDLRDKFPNSQIAVNVSPYGTASLRRQGIGTLT